MWIGEGFAGSGADAAHVNTVLGSRDGPVGTAWATSLATPSSGHARFMVVVRPGLAVQPPTLFVPKATFSGELHEKLTFGAAQAGVAGGVADALDTGVVAEDDSVLIAAVWVNPDASDEKAVYRNNREATYQALASGAIGGPAFSDVIDAANAGPSNPYFTP